MRSHCPFVLRRLCKNWVDFLDWGGHSPGLNAESNLARARTRKAREGLAWLDMVAVPYSCAND
jgi:hypothetical protein